MKKISKRVLALMMALIMAMPMILAAPFSASAETVSEATVKSYGLVRTGNSSRGSGNNGCITNDGGDDNMSAILWEIDLSGIKTGFEVVSATFSEDIWSISNTNIPNQYLDFWYCNPADMSNYSNYLNNSNYRDSSLGYGTTGPSTYKTAFGITESTPLYSVLHVFDSDSATISFSNDALVDALNKAVDENWGSIVFAAMYNEPAATTWSDIWAGLPKLSYETQEMDAETLVKEKIASYSGANLTAKSGGIQFSSGGNAYTENVLYTANGNFDSDYFEAVVNGNNKLGFNIYPASSRVVYLYDSDDAVIGYPLIAKIQKSAATATTMHFGVNYIVTDTANDWILKNDWFSCSGDRIWDNTYDSQSDKAYGVNKINYSTAVSGHGNEDITAGSWYSHSEGHFTDSSPITVANAMYYDSSKIDFGGGYYYSIPAVPTFKASADACAHWLGNQGSWNNLENWTGITINGKTDIELKVLNIKPLKDIVSSADFLSNFNSIADDEWMYTEESLDNYYNAVADIMKFDVNEFDYSSDAGLEAAATEINALIEGYETYKTPALKTFSVTFKNADGITIDERNITAGETLGALPENSNPSHIDGTNTHNVYSWVGVFADTVVEADSEFSESASAEACSFTASHTEATEDENGFTTYSCVCGNNYSEYDAQDFTAYDEAIALYEATISASDYETNYTSSSRAAYVQAVDDAKIDKTQKSLSPSAIAKAALDINNALDLLDEHGDLTALRKAYSRGNELLLGLDEKGAQYTQESLDALINALSDSDVEAYLTLTNTDNIGKSDEAIANMLADNIEYAIDSLESSISGTDVSAYAIAVETINNLDLDVYSNETNIGSAIRVSGKVIQSVDVAYTDILDSSNTAAIKALPLLSTQQNVDDATRTILDALNYCIKVYTITTNDAVEEVSFQNGKTTGESSPYTATYGANVIAHSTDSDTAWYMEFTSNSTSRGMQYQGYGKTFITKAIANIHIYAEKRTAAAPNMVKIFRNYSNDPEASPIHSVAFVDDSYELPEMPAIQYYDFSGFAVNGDTDNLLQAGEVIDVTGDTEIKAMYTFNGSADYAINAVALANGTGFNSSVAYNTRIELEGGDDAYAWVETVDEATGKCRPFAIGSDITFFATESVILTAVTKEQFDAYGFAVPSVNMRKDGVIVYEGKTTFTGQIIDENATVREFGVLVGISKNGEDVTNEELTVDNVGSFADYDVFRAKASGFIGTNQFAIKINGLTGKNYKYRGYLIYMKTNGEYVTVYTDLM